MKTDMGDFLKESNRIFRNEDMIVEVRNSMDMLNSWLDTGERKIGQLI